MTEIRWPPAGASNSADRGTCRRWATAPTVHDAAVCCSTLSGWRRCHHSLAADRQQPIARDEVFQVHKFCRRTKPLAQSLLTSFGPWPDYEHEFCLTHEARLALPRSTSLELLPNRVFDFDDQGGSAWSLRVHVWSHIPLDRWICHPRLDVNLARAAFLGYADRVREAAPLTRQKVLASRRRVAYRVAPELAAGGAASRDGADRGVGALPFRDSQVAPRARTS